MQSTNPTYRVEESTVTTPDGSGSCRATICNDIHIVVHGYGDTFAEARADMRAYIERGIKDAEKMVAQRRAQLRALDEAEKAGEVKP